MKSRVIYQLSDYSNSKKGWVYFLVSSDRRYLKIGKTSSSVEERINAINSKKCFRSNNFHLLLAYNDASLERHFLSYFEKYRARYNWRKPSEEQFRLTYDELRRVATAYCRKEYGCYRKHHISDAICKFGQTTRDELCKIPPRKLAPYLTSIIESELKLLNGTRRVGN